MIIIISRTIYMIPMYCAVNINVVPVVWIEKIPL